ncbi:MAG TPA: sodium:solute symporter [Pirellulales bacterium]|jgi:SSS family solute:Na+ symporter/sodium/pantothenate symporter|nr:sodium:solute symporter [Pirellulales bacterium]
MPASQPTVGYGAMVALLGVIGVSIWLGAKAQQVVRQSSFLSGYFLGNRGLGAWALALTATVQSGGTFMGYPSMVYTHGWIVGLWIAGYMVVPITAFAVFGKRLAQLSHRTGAITVPDMFRARFASPTLGLISSLLILCFMSLLMVAQFKAGAILMKSVWPDSTVPGMGTENVADIDVRYYVGLAVFSITVIGYTLVGGFLASVWTDMFQSMLMAVGVVLLFVLVVPAASHAGFGAPTLDAVRVTGPEFASGPGYAVPGHSFFPPTLALSYFVVWVFGGLGTPAGMIRVMASKDTPTLRRSIVLLSIYNLLIYLPLLVICICARAILPGLKVPDEVVPQLALWATRDLPGGSLVTGLILAAPLGAVMSTISAYLVVIASSLVRDVYQHFFRPAASQAEVRRVAQGVMIVLGVAAVGASIRPVDYLQTLIVFSAAACGATFFVPAWMLAYWPRATAAGAGAAMLAGAGTILGLLVTGLVLAHYGWHQEIDHATAFPSYYPGGFHPLIFALAASLIAGVVVSRITKPPPRAIVAKLFLPPSATPKKTAGPAPLA